MSNISRRNQDKMAKGKQRDTSKWLLENKENTPPVTRSKSRPVKLIHKCNVPPMSSVKTKAQEKKNKIEEDSSRSALPVKVKPVIKHTKKIQMTLNVSPVHRQRSVSNSGNNDASHSLLPFDETLVDNSFASTTLLPAEKNKDDSWAYRSNIVLRRKSSNTIDKEACMLTSANPPLEYWKMLAEQRLCATEKTLHQNEMMYDQLFVLEAENSQLKEVLKQAKEMIMFIKTSI